MIQQKLPKPSGQKVIDFPVLLAKPSLVASRTFLQCILQISTSFKSTLKHLTTIRVSSLFLKLLFKTSVACDMPGAMQKIRMPEVGRHIQSQMSHICSKITKFAGTSISPLPHCLWPSNLAGWWLTMRSSHSQSKKTLWLHGLERSRHKLKTLYLY